MQNNKLNKKDFILISILGVILTIVMFVSITGFFDTKFLDFGNEVRKYSDVSTTEQIADTILKIPYFTLFLVLYPFYPAEGGFNAAILAALFSPLSGFVFWFLLFYIFARIGNYLLKTRHFFLKHSLSILITLFITVVFVHFYLTTIAK